MHLATSLVAQVGTEPFKRLGRGRHDAALPAGLHDQTGQHGELVVLDGLREQRVQQLGEGATAKRAQAEVLLALHGMALPAPLGLDVFAYRTRHSADLLGHELHHGSGRALAGPQCAAGLAQVAEHQRVAEPVVVAAAALGCGQVLGRHGVMAHQLALLNGRVEQLRELGFTQLLPSRHSCLLPHWGRQTIRSGQGSRSACCA